MPFVKVKSVSEQGAWRAGRKWTQGGFDQAPVEVTDEQLKALQADPKLHVQLADAAHPSALKDKGHKGATEQPAGQQPTEGGDLKRKP